jgi:hypothetical protein
VRARGPALAAALLVLALIAPATAGAHGIGGIRDLPVPGWLFLIGGATVLVVSFVALGALWRTPKLKEDAGDPAPPMLQRVLLSAWTRRVVQTLSLGLFVVIWSAAAFGSDRASENLAPTFIYVVFWVGMVLVCIVLGNVWTVLNPWRAAADLVAWIGARLGWSREPRPYPERLGIWPAAVLLCSFTVLELVWADPAVPQTLAEATLVYSVCTWMGMLVYGRKAWLANGDGFTVFYSFLSRAALFGTRQRPDGRREIIVRKPLSALAHVERRPGAVAFFAVMLGTVAFDGLSRSTWWLTRLYDVETHFASAKDAEHAVEAVNLSGLVLAVVLVATLYTLAVKAAEGVVGEQVDFRGVFVCSLVPIAIVYALSHYFSLLVIQGQFAIPLVSDPYGKGWDLFGTSSFEPNLAILTPNLVWYVQVSVLVLGHVAGLIVAHDRAVALSPSPRIALRTQYAMLTLMVLFTVGGMWLLSIG